MSACGIRVILAMSGCLAYWGHATTYDVYLGTRPSDEAIATAYRTSFDAETGKLGPVSTIPKTALTRCVTVARDHLIFASRRQRKGEPQTTTITTYRQDGPTVTPISHQRLDGGVCAMTVVEAADRAFVLGADFPGGTLVVLPMNGDGQLEEPSQIIQHPTLPARPGDKKPRQSRMHDVDLTPDRQALLVTDLGLQWVVMYRLDPATGTLSKIGTLEIADRGPRHLAFHPTLPIAYVVTQGGQTVVAFNYDTKTGNMTFLKRLPTVPAGYDGRNNCADIQVHPSGRFLYASNRGHNSIAMYTLTSDGDPSFIGTIPSGGEIPSNIALTPCGVYALVSNNRSNNLCLFRIDRQTGRLVTTNQVVTIPAPSSLVLTPVTK